MQKFQFYNYSSQLTPMKQNSSFSLTLTLLITIMLIPHCSQVKLRHTALTLAEGRYFIKLNDLYLAVNNPVKDGDYQRAQFAKIDYIEGDAGRYSKQVWLKKTSDGSGYFIFSRFGDVDSYLHVNGLVKSNDYQKAYFASLNYLFNKTNYQYSYWLEQPNGLKYKIHVGQGNQDSILSAEAITDDYQWAYFYSSDNRKYVFNQVEFIKLEDNHTDFCSASDQLPGNSATFYMTSDPQFRFGSYGNGGRKDGDQNARKTYNFLKSQVQVGNCPQSFIAIAGDLNHDKTDWQDTFFEKFESPTVNKFVADVLGNHDIMQLPKNSMVEKFLRQITDDLFQWRKAVRVRYPQRATTTFGTITDAYYSKNPATFYTIQLRNKINDKYTPRDLVAYVIMTHNILQDNLWYLNYVSSQPDFNTTVPIILVSHTYGKWNANLSDWISGHRVAAHLFGHAMCPDSYMGDHCDRRSVSSNFVQTKKFGDKDVVYINTSGVRDRVFWSVSVNNTHISLTRKAWTNSKRLPGFEVPNLPILIKI